MVYNKLVRDLIPQVIKDHGKKLITRTLTDEEFQKELEKKLQEEVAEYLDSDGDIEEMSDILEVMFAIIGSRGYTFEEVLKAKEEKAQKRGGFSKKVFLIEAI